MKGWYPLVMVRATNPSRKKEEFVSAEMPEGTVHWSKTQSMSKDTSACGALREVYENAIFLDLFPIRMRGYITMFVSFLLAMTCFMFFVAINFTFKFLPATIQSEGFLLIIFGAALTTFLWLLTIAATISCLKNLRIDLLGPKLLPVIFNRKTRKVYRYSVDIPMWNSFEQERGFWRALLPFWKSAFKPWPVTITEYDWDKLEAEYTERTQMVGKTLQKIQHLGMRATDPQTGQLLDLFSLMLPTVSTKSDCEYLWEHIRRYMEEGGPPANRGESLAPPVPRNLLAAAQCVLPFVWPLVVALGLWTAHETVFNPVTGMWYGHGLAHSHVVHPHSNIMTMGWVLGMPFTIAIIANWLAHKTGVKIPMPREIIQDLGQKIDLEAEFGCKRKWWRL